jgi:hypothetical protein
VIAIAATLGAASVIAIGIPGAPVAAYAASVPTASRAAIDARRATVRTVDYGPFAACRAVKAVAVKAAAIKSATVEAIAAETAAVEADEPAAALG